MKTISSHLKWTMIGQKAITTALLGFNDLGRLVTPPRSPYLCEWRSDTPATIIQQVGAFCSDNSTHGRDQKVIVKTRLFLSVLSPLYKPSHPLRNVLFSRMFWMKNAKSAKIKLVKSKDGNSEEIAMQLPPMSGLVMRKLGSRCHRTDCPTCFVERHWRKRLVYSML